MEVQFYVLAPIFANVFLLPKSVRRIILIGLVSFGDLTRTVGAIIPHTTILDFYQFFLVGLLLADFYVSGDLEGSNEILSCFIAVLGFGLIWVGSERGLALRIGMFCFCAFRSRIIRNPVGDSNRRDVLFYVLVAPRFDLYLWTISGSTVFRILFL